MLLSEVLLLLCLNQCLQEVINKTLQGAKRLLFNSDPWPPAEQKLEMPCDIFIVVRFTVYSHNGITVHSTVYMYVLKESKQVSHNGIYFLQVNDPDANKSWYELGEEAGLEIVDDEEEEEKIQKEEEDKEVAFIFKESKQRHKQMLRGMCVKRVNRNKIHVLIVFLLMSKESKVPVYKVNKQDVTHVKQVERNKIHVLIAILYLLVYFRNH